MALGDRTRAEFASNSPGLVFARCGDIFGLPGGWGGVNHTLINLLTEKGGFQVASAKSGNGFRS